MCSPGKRHTRTKLWCKRKRLNSTKGKTGFIRTGHLLLLLSGPVLMLIRPLLVLLAVDRGQHGLCSLIRNKLGSTVYSSKFLSEPALTSSAIWKTVVCLLDWTTLASLSLHQWAHDSVIGLPLFFPWTTFKRYWPVQTRNTELQFWRCSDPVINILALVILAPPFMPAPLPSL